GRADGCADHAGPDADDEEHVAAKTLWERRTQTMDSGMVRIVCAVLAALFLGLIVLRRKKTPE
ncbi:MAG: hypothetical protein ACREMY_19050, partial [bacterium]